MSPFLRYFLGFTFPVTLIFIFIDYKEKGELRIVEHILVAALAGLLFAYTINGIQKRRRERENNN